MLTHLSWSCNHTVISTLNTQDMKLNSQKLSLTPVSFFSSDFPVMLLGTLCEMVRQLLVKLKDLVCKENIVGSMYKIKCEECDAVYCRFVVCYVILIVLLVQFSVTLLAYHHGNTG